MDAKEDPYTVWLRSHKKRTAERLQAYDELIAGYDNLIAFNKAALYTLLAIPLAVVLTLIVGRVFGFISD